MSTPFQEPSPFQDPTPYQQPPHQDTFSAEQPPVQRTGGGWLRGCLIGCLCAFVVGVGVCAGIGWFVYSNWKVIAGDVTRKVIVNAVENSELDEEEKRAIVAQVDRVVDKFKSGEISNEDLGRIWDELAKSPLFGAILIRSIEAKYVAPSGLSDEEKEQARVTLQRVLRGAYEGTIDTDDLNQLTEHMTIEKPDGSHQLKESVTDQELRDFLAECKKKADEAEVPDEPFEVKISEEFRRAVDRALSK